jgi:4-alpha-glucanotransferase
VDKLRLGLGLPGMRVLQFGFDDAKSTHAPHGHASDAVVYTGTHDNPPLAAWLDSLRPDQRQRLQDYTGCQVGGEHEATLRLAYASVAFLTILPVQDMLGLGTEARMNTPAQAAGNWSWRLLKSQLTDELAINLWHFANLYDRLPPAPDGA